MRLAKLVGSTIERRPQEQQEQQEQQQQQQQQQQDAPCHGVRGAPPQKFFIR